MFEPLFDIYGRVIGIVTYKLSDSWSLENSGVVPQNVNFAIKSSVSQIFLSSNGVSLSAPDAMAEVKSIPDIADIAKDVTVHIGCYSAN